MKFSKTSLLTLGAVATVGLSSLTGCATNSVANQKRHMKPVATTATPHSFKTPEGQTVVIAQNGPIKLELVK